MSTDEIPKGYFEEITDVEELDALDAELDFFTEGKREDDEDKDRFFKIPDRKMDLAVCSVAYILDEGLPVVVLFCRDKNGVDYVIPDRNFEPYFYIEKNDQIPLLTKIREEYGKDAFVDFEGTEIYGLGSNTTLSRVYTKKPNEVEKYRKLLRIPTWEADILYPNRYMIDKGIMAGITFDPSDGSIVPCDVPSKYRKMYIDIETHSFKSPDPKNTPDEVIVIGLYDDYTNEYTIMTTKHVKIDDPEQYLTKRKSTIRIVYFDNEITMLKSFVSYVETVRPDLFMGFTPYDWMYLVNRMFKLGLRYRPLSRVNVVQIFGDGSKIKIHGMEFLDIQKMYYQVFLRGSKWETLHGIAWRELGEEKLYREESIYDNWNNHPERVVIRNIRDVEIVYRLDSELNLTSYFDAIKRVIGGNFDDTVYKSRIADILYLRLCHDKMALPTKILREKIAYQGAIVFPVTPGIYRNIVIFDWSSMYPSIIKSFNMSFETLSYIKSGDNYNIDDQFYFRKDVVGWTVQLLHQLEPLRVPYKKKAKDKSLSKEERAYNQAVSEGIKSVINSIYGVFGQAGDQVRIKAYRMYLPDVAAATTYVGRKLEEDGLFHIAPRIGYKLLYADTDSVFLQMKTDKIEEEIEYLEKELSSAMNKFITDRWGVNPQGLQLSFDKFYKTLVMFAKKRYIGETEDGQLVTKGLEMVRKNTADISAEIQEQVAKAIFSGKSNDEIIALCKSFVSQMYTRPLEEIGIAQNLTKTLQEYDTFSSHMKAFIWSCDQLALNLVLGKRFWTIYIKTSELPKTYSNRVYFVTKDGKVVDKEIDVVAWDDQNELPDDIKMCIDYDKMIEVTLHKKVEDFLDLLGIRWYEDVLGIMNPKTQKKLAKFEKFTAKMDSKGFRYVGSMEDTLRRDFVCPVNKTESCPYKDCEAHIKKNKNCEAGMFGVSGGLDKWIRSNKQGD